MKRITAWLLICLLMMGVAPAHALTKEEALDKVSSYLTEVYSYTAEEAEKFEAFVELKQDGWLISYWHKDHPEWAYTAVYDPDKDKVTNALTPFYSMDQFADYPGEGTVREGLNRARKYGWFSIWEPHMHQALQQFMAEWGIKPTAKLNEGLSTGEITAGNALHEYFLSCYGDEMNWTPALKQWHNAELEYYGLTYDDAEPVVQGIVSHIDTAYNDLKVEMTRFVDEVPEALQQVFSHPKLQGWTCLCGATAQNVDNRAGYGLAAFEKDGERLLVGLKTDTESKEWWLSPISNRALYTDKKMHILYENGMQKNQFTIVYENTETETERFEVYVGSVDGNRLDASVSRYSRMDQATGNGLTLVIDYGVRAITYEAHQKTGEENGAKSFINAMSMMDIATFPTSVEAWKKGEQEVIPEGYALVRGVHLRQKTSSRSRDLGEYENGVLAKVLGTEPGDPWTWYHVQIGRAKGYMASAYVSEAVTQDTGYILNRPLSIAQAKQTIKLKKGMSWLSGTIQKVPEGTRMQVLAKCDGGWLHVSIPQGELSWTMDLNGIDGYIKEKDVLLGGTLLTLEWME